MLTLIENTRPLHMDELGMASAGEWDAFVRSRNEGTFCHLYGWRSIMEELLGHEVRYLAARNEDCAIVGVLPLVRVRSRLFGDYMVSMPFLNDGGPIGDPDAVRFLAGHAEALARRSGVDLLELRSRDVVPGDLETSDRKVTVLLDLPEDPEVLWKGFRSKVRSQIRRPLKEGMETRIGIDQILPFYDVYARHMRDLGTPVLPLAFFLRALHLFEDHLVLAAVYHEGEPVAAGAGFVHGDEFEITWAAALREHNRLAPNMLLYWRLMEEMCRRGLKTFNFGRCTPGGGTHRFKLQWGGYDLPLPWAQWSPRSLDATPSPDAARYRLATRAWQNLPLVVTNRLGPWLARRIP